MQVENTVTGKKYDVVSTPEKCTLHDDKGILCVSMTPTRLLQAIADCTYKVIKQ